MPANLSRSRINNAHSKDVAGDCHILKLNDDDKYASYMHNDAIPLLNSKPKSEKNTICNEKPDWNFSTRLDTLNMLYFIPNTDFSSKSPRAKKRVLKTKNPYLAKNISINNTHKINCSQTKGDTQHTNKETMKKILTRFKRITNGPIDTNKQISAFYNDTTDIPVVKIFSLKNLTLKKNSSSVEFGVDNKNGKNYNSPFFDAAGSQLAERARELLVTIKALHAQVNFDSTFTLKNQENTNLTNETRKIIP